MELKLPFEELQTALVRANKIPRGHRIVRVNRPRMGGYITLHLEPDETSDAP